MRIPAALYCSTLLVCLLGQGRQGSMSSRRKCFAQRQLPVIPSEVEGSLDQAEKSDKPQAPPLRSGRRTRIDCAHRFWGTGIYFFSLFLFGALVVPSVQAQVPPDTTVVLPEITVEEVRERTSAALLPGRVTTLGTASIAATNARSVAELLEARTSLFLKRYGDGGLATVSFRGTNASQTLLLMDGQRLADPQSGQIDLSLVPTVVLASADVSHGAGSSLYGSDGIGGVVHLRTLAPTAQPSFRVTSSHGAYGTQRIGGVITGRHNAVSGLLAIETSKADGDFVYVNEALFPAENTRREGAERSLLTGFAKLHYERGTSLSGLTFWYNQAKRGLPGPGNAAPSGARQWDDHIRVMGHHTQRLAASTLTLNASAQTTKLRYANPRNATDQTSRTQAYALTGRWNKPLHQHWLLTAGADLGHDVSDLAHGHRQTRWAALVHGLGEYERVLLYPALRFDQYSSEQKLTTALSPRLGINAQPFASETLRLKASVGRAFRMPTFNERFWQPGGNPNLEPERGWTADAGGLLQRVQPDRSFSAETSVFYTRLRDQVVWHPSFVGPGVQVWSPSNLSRVVSRGVEASLEGRLRGVQGGLLYTYTAAEDRSRSEAQTFSKQVRYVPREQLKLWLGIGWQGLQLDVHARFIGRRFITADETQALPTYHVVDAQLRYTKRTKRLDASLGLYLENLLDAQYSVIRFYPMPPRHARVRLTLHLHAPRARTES